MTKTLRLAAVLSALSLAPSAWAHTFTIDYADRESIDPALNFEQDCLGETEAEDCPERAAALHVELVELLGHLGTRNDPETMALFEAAAAMDDPRLQEIALRYFTYVPEPPSGLWAQVRAFFFGPDANVGHPSAELLGRSLEDLDQELSRLYLEGRPLRMYGGEVPQGSGLTDSWAEARARDALLDAVESFPEEDRFPEASRLLMLDRFVTDPFAADPLAEVPVTVFVTDASVAEVEAHFTSLFGSEPYLSLSEALLQQELLLAELLELQQRIMGGDFSVGERIEEVGFELERAQNVSLLGSRLGLEAAGAADHVFWMEGAVEDPFSAPLARAVAIGTDPRVEQTVIRYFAGASAADANPDSGEGGTGAGGQDGTGSGGEDGNGNNEGGQPDIGHGGEMAGNGGSRAGDSGCGCAVPGAPSNASAMALVALLAWAARRRRGQKR